MNRTALEIARLVEQALQKLRLPASQIVNQLAGTQVAPATSAARGAVKLSDSTPASVGTAAAGTAATVSRSDHVHGQQSHNHTSAANDGGVLTNDAHDGYADYTEISAPATPAANAVRLYARDKSGVAELFYKNDGGTERDLSVIGALTVEEVDGSPTGAIETLKFPNGTIGIVGSVATYTPIASGGETSTGAAGSEPGSPTAGDLYFPNNSFTIERYSGSAWDAWGPIYPLATPPSSGWSWVNQDTASETTYGGVRVLTDTATTNATPRAKLRVRTAPSAPYTVTAFVVPNKIAAANSQCGIGWRQSSDGKLVLLRLIYNGGEKISVVKMASPTSDVADYVSIDFPPRPIWLKIEDDNTNRKSYLSNDGQHWILLHSVSRTDYLTADQIGFFIDSRNATYNSSVALLSWKEA